MKDVPTRPEPNVTVIRLNHMRPQVVRVLIAQAAFQPDDWVQDRGLYRLRDVTVLASWIDRIKNTSREYTVDMVLFPELSIPIDSVPRLQQWSRETGVTVIAGSHYHGSGSRTIARCPVIIAGEVFFVEKLNPAPIELSPVPGEGLSAGSSVSVFLGTPVGNLGVLVCSDYLDARLRSEVLATGVDLLCVPSFQRDSSMYHQRMHIDCEEHHEGLYITYANSFCDGVGDGMSACFGVVDHMFLEKLQSAHLTDGSPPTKACSLAQNEEGIVVDLDMTAKRPTVPRTIRTHPNVTVVASIRSTDVRSGAFAAAVAHDDERYRNIERLFVPPAEFGVIREKLESNHIVFIVGDPGIGKTYTAAMLLKLYYDKGYRPTWFTGLEREERLMQRQVL